MRTGGSDVRVRGRDEFERGAERAGRQAGAEASPRRAARHTFHGLVWADSVRSAAGRVRAVHPWAKSRGRQHNAMISKRCAYFSRTRRRFRSPLFLYNRFPFFNSPLASFLGTLSVLESCCVCAEGISWETIDLGDASFCTCTTATTWLATHGAALQRSLAHGLRSLETGSGPPMDSRTHRAAPGGA